jgi:hypothetical protein
MGRRDTRRSSERGEGRVLAARGVKIVVRLVDGDGWPAVRIGWPLYGCAEIRIDELLLCADRDGREQR